uniref:Suppressor of cytokine signaling 7 n=1 Tax=Strigamia maritima TaxID=126957 RepID=T1IPI0_STRMM
MNAMNEMNPSDLITAPEMDEISPHECVDNTFTLTNGKVDGNGNMSTIPLSDEENDGVLLMVSCKNFLQENAETNLEDTNAGANSGEESNDEYEFWSFSKEGAKDGENISKTSDDDENPDDNKRSAYYFDGLSTPYRHRIEPSTEPIHMTLEEVKISLQRLYGTNKNENNNKQTLVVDGFGERGGGNAKKGPFMQMRRRNRKGNEDLMSEKQRSHQRKSFPSALKQTLRGWFKKGQASCAVVHSKSSEELSSHHVSDDEREDGGSNLLNTPSQSIPSLSPFANRALPPLPMADGESGLDGGPDSENDEYSVQSSEPADFTSSIHKVKDYGWYWGPISGEAAEKLLANEPDGSFIVRDSSDEHYIFSLTFKLNGLVRHVRIEHDQGNFSFGTFTNFRSHTIVGFIENAVEHSRSGRYLFFLHRRPLLGPMRVQLLHPVSRFKQVQSLQHMCRFVILKAVRRDLITQLPLPKRLKDYLNTAQYYTEDVDANPNKPPPVVTPEQHILLGDASDSADR